MIIFPVAVRRRQGPAEEREIIIRLRYCPQSGMCLILHPKFNSQSTAMKTSRHISPWKKVHKWVGVTMTVFLLLFCVSGIILNHRKLFSSCSVSRSLLPASYHIRNFNNGIIKGTLPYGPGDSLLAYGNAGVWLTDRNFSRFSDFNRGLPQGADNRNIRNTLYRCLFS